MMRDRKLIDVRRGLAPRRQCLDLVPSRRRSNFHNRRPIQTMMSGSWIRHEEVVETRLSTPEVWGRATTPGNKAEPMGITCCFAVRKRACNLRNGVQTNYLAAPDFQRLALRTGRTFASLCTNETKWALIAAKASCFFGQRTPPPM
jgi:hypothetical protein